jgi:hypothetical protein
LFTPDDYWKIFQYLYESRDLEHPGPDVPELDSTIKSISDSERAKTTALFENTIDQVCFNTNDYNRLKTFLIDWYSSFKTQISLQKDFQDPFALPPEYLNELVRSFGYPYPGDITSVNSRASFFLDLVNLYKIKGTPEALKSALDYYGLRNVDFVEYWLQKNTQGDLAFKGVPIFTPTYKINWPDVEFEATGFDPHWFQTKQDIIQLLDQNEIGLPSKSPYFGLRPFYSLSQIQQTMAILTRTVADQYETWQSTTTLQRDLKLNLLNITVSVLETYLACCHIINSAYEYQDPISYSPPSYLCYDGTSIITTDIVAEYDALTSYPAWNADDPETKKATGLATGGTSISLVDITKNFVVSGVIIGDMVTRTTPLSSGGTATITSITTTINTNDTLNFYPLSNGLTPTSFSPGDSYLISGGEIAFRASRVAQFNDLFTRPAAQNFIKTKTGPDSPGEILNAINPTFKATVDSWIFSGRYYELLASLLEDLSGWIRVHIDTTASDLISIVLGISSSPPVARIINFFKPYRARLLTTQFYYIIDNPVFDYVRIYDREFYLKVQHNFYDYVTANSIACCGDDEISCSQGSSLILGLGHGSLGHMNLGHAQGTLVIEPILYSRETYDCGSYHDIGIVWDQPIFIAEVVNIADSLNCHRSECPSDNTSCEYWYETSPGFDGTTDAEVIITGGFRDFDSNWVFDCPEGSDIVNIFLDTGGYGSGYYGAGYYGDRFHY